MKKKTYAKFVHHWEQVTDLPPQSVGIFTPLYKEVTKKFKIMPWPAFLLIALAVAVSLYMMFGASIVNLTSVLQRGF